MYVNPPRAMPFTGTFTNSRTTRPSTGATTRRPSTSCWSSRRPRAVKTFRLTGLNGIDMTITIENNANVVYRWFGDDRVLMTEDVADGRPSGPAR